MSSNQDYQFARPLSLSELIGFSFKLFFSNFFVWIFYLLAFLLFTLYLFIVNDLGYPSSLNVNFDNLVSSIGFSDPNSDPNELLSLYNTVLFSFFTESLVISVILSVPYALTLFFVKSNFEKVLLNNLLIKTESIENQDTKSLVPNLKYSLTKVIPKIFPIIIAAFILNLLTLIGLLLFIIPGIIISGLVSLVPVILLSEPDATVGKSFGRSYGLVKGFLFKTILLLVFIGIIQYFLSIFIQLLLNNIYLVISGIDPEQLTTSTDPLLVVIRYVSQSFFAPLSIISLILLYNNLKLENQMKFQQTYNYGVQNQQKFQQPYNYGVQSQSAQVPLQPQLYQTENIIPSNGKRIFCMDCGKPNPLYGSFCAFCGKKLLKPAEVSVNVEKTPENIDLSKNVCKFCGKPPRKSEDKFCAYCGMKYEK